MMIVTGFPKSKPQGGYISIELQVSSVNDGWGIIAGILGGYQTKSGFMIGAGIYDLLSDTPFPYQSGKGQDLLRRTKMRFGGLILGYEFESSGDNPFRFSSLIGIGDISAYTYKKKDSKDASIYYVAQPQVSLILVRETPYHPVLTAGYRLHNGVSTSGTSDVVLGGPSVGLTAEHFW